MLQQPDYDSNLWFMMGTCCPGKHFLLYNPHTFPGRMAAWCPNLNVKFNVSKSEIQECSIEARYWIQGFLSGNEPDAPRDSDGYYLPDDSPEFGRWRASIQQFPITGLWLWNERTCQNCGEKLLPTEPHDLCPKCAASVCHNED